ncbi:MAG: hypothetical protein IJL38_04980 [Bacteroidales bacterium]|nr:hypothetical protein [Bacteroidales bacterium]
MKLFSKIILFIITACAVVSSATAQDSDSLLRQQIREQHLLISRQCNPEGIADKERARLVKNIFYSYLAIFNRSNNGNTNELEQLLQFQKHLRDSVLSISGYQAHIDNFKNTLKLRCGKEQIDIYKNYCRIYQVPAIAANFTNYEEYANYVARLREVVDIQDAYIAAVDINQQISASSGSILAQYTKPAQSSAYKNMMASINLMPQFTTLQGAEEYIVKMLELNTTQQTYIDNYPRLQATNQRSDYIYSLGRRYSDITAAFRLVDQGTNLNPDYCSMDGYREFLTKMSIFEEVQQHYLHSIFLRDTLNSNEYTIEHANLKILREGYQHLKNYYPRTPDFNTPQGGRDYISRQHFLLQIQQQCLSIIEEVITSDALEKDVLAATKKYSYVRRLYNNQLADYNYRSAIASKEDLQLYQLLWQKKIQFQRKLIQEAEKRGEELDKAVKRGEIKRLEIE